MLTRSKTITLSSSLRSNQAHITSSHVRQSSSSQLNHDHHLHRRRCSTSNSTSTATTPTTVRVSLVNAQQHSRFQPQSQPQSHLYTIAQTNPKSFHRFQSQKSRQHLLRFFSSAAAASGDVMVLIDHDNTAIKPAALAAVTAAKKLGSSNITAVVAGFKCQSAAEQAAKIDGVNRVIVADDSAFQHQLTENVTSLLQEIQIQFKFSHLVTSSGTVGKNIFPRLAATLDVAPITDVVRFWC